MKKDFDSAKGKVVKAYNDTEFLNSPDARNIRVLCEFTEPRSRLRKSKVDNTVVFFGSARTRPRADAEKDLNECKKRLEQSPHDSEIQKLFQKLQNEWIGSQYYEDAMHLSEKLTQWFKTLKGRINFVICSGGGPGIMEAANRGAFNVQGESMALNISLPFEQVPNIYQTRELAFEFHYFFIRKFWFVYLAKAVVIFPGGFGTLDEMFELLTLIQTQKLRKHIPIVIYGSKFWKEIINLDALLKWNMISPDDLTLFRFCDDVDSTFDFLKEQISKHYLNGNPA